MYETYIDLFNQLGLLKEKNQEIMSSSYFIQLDGLNKK